MITRARTITQSITVKAGRYLLKNAPVIETNRGVFFGYFFVSAILALLREFTFV